MRTTLSQVRSIIREELARHLNEEWWAESYSGKLYDEPALDPEKETLWIEKDSKRKIKKWMKDMGLAEAVSNRDILARLQNLSDSNVEYIKDPLSYRAGSLRFNELEYITSNADPTTIALKQHPSA